MEITRIQPNGRLSRAVKGNGMVYVTGQVARDRSPDCHAQTSDVLGIIDELLAEAGTHRDKILFAQVWLKDIAADFGAMNAAWEAWVDPEKCPARATVEARLAADNILVEIAVTALA